MKKLIYLLFLLVTSMTAVSCVDEYYEANPALPLDAPYSVLTVEEDTLIGGESTPFTLRIVDAPGLVDSISYTTTGDKGTVTFDEASVQSVIGKSSGTITGTFTAPTNATGNFDLSIVVWDQQEPRQSLTATQRLRIVYEFTFPATVLASVTAEKPTINLGESTPVSFNFNIPAGFGGISLFSSFGTIELDSASYREALGDVEGTILATYYAPEAPTADVGPVAFTVIIRDQQERERTFANISRVTVTYPIAVPTIEFVGPSSMVVGDTVEYAINIAAPGVITDVEVNAFFANSTETIEGLTFDEEELAALVGTTGGTLNVSFSNDAYIGYVDISVTVIDEQGATITESYLLLIEPE